MWTREGLLALDPVVFAVKQLGFTPDSWQAKVLRSGVKRGILNCARQSGKSTVMAVMAVHRALYQAKSLILVVSPVSRQSGEFMENVHDFTGRMDIEKRWDGHNEISQLYSNGSRIVGLPAVDDNIRGFASVSLAFIDEAARVPDALLATLLPMLMVSKGDLWLMSTPVARRGLFWDSWNKPEYWTRFTAMGTECPRFSPEFLEQCRVLMGERKYRREFLCEFGDDDDAVFSGDVLERAVDQDEEGLR